MCQSLFSSFRCNTIGWKMFIKIKIVVGWESNCWSRTFEATTTHQLYINPTASICFCRELKPWPKFVTIQVSDLTFQLLCQWWVTSCYNLNLPHGQWALHFVMHHPVRRLKCTYNANPLWGSREFESPKVQQRSIMCNILPVFPTIAM